MTDLIILGFMQTRLLWYDKRETQLFFMLLLLIMLRLILDLFVLSMYGDRDRHRLCPLVLFGVINIGFRSKDLLCEWFSSRLPIYLNVINPNHDCYFINIFIYTILRYKIILSTILSNYHFYMDILQYNLILQIKILQYFLQMSKEDQIRKENKKLREIVEGYLEQIEKFKKINEQHQTQIQTLLKFNERLLIIIETQLNTYNNRKSERSLSLQPISQITQKDSQAVDMMGSIKASLINTYKMNQLDIPERSKNTHDKKDGHETERVMLGDHLEDALSYEISRSDYQKEYSEYSKNEKVKQVMALINAYKQEYGESIKECEDIKLKLKEDALKDNMEMKNLNEENQNFYDSKKVELTNLKQKIKQSTPQKEIEKILNSKKYSSGTQAKLMKIMNKIN